MVTILMKLSLAESLYLVLHMPGGFGKLFLA